MIKDYSESQFLMMFTEINRMRSVIILPFLDILNSGIMWSKIC